MNDHGYGLSFLPGRRYLLTAVSDSQRREAVRMSEGATMGAALSAMRITIFEMVKIGRMDKRVDDQRRQNRNAYGITDSRNLGIFGGPTIWC